MTRLGAETTEVKLYAPVSPVRPHEDSFVSSCLGAFVRSRRAVL